MATTRDIDGLIREAIEDFNAQAPGASPISLEPGTVLFGEGGVLDSISLVNLIVTLEAFVEDNLGAVVVLADERAMSRRHSPFRTIETLASYLRELLEDAECV